MPSLNFILPHWLYWGVLLLFPLVAMWLVARQRRRGAPREPILFNAYLFWLTIAPWPDRVLRSEIYFDELVDDSIDMSFGG